MQNPFDFTGRIAVVTGASQGIGAVTARVLAEQGAQLVIAARGGEKLDAQARNLRTATGRQVLAVATNVADESDVLRLAASTIAEFGRVDILVNNAGGPLRSPFETTSAEDWDTV